MRYSRVIKIIICTAILLLIHNAGFTQLMTPFTPRFSARLNGDFVSIGNNVLSTTATGNYTGDAGNHNLVTVFVDIDNDATTFNSSSANFTKPVPNTTCVSIKKAYLYWAAADFEESTISNEPSWSYNTAKLMLPGSSTYTTITADNVIFCGRCQTNHFQNDPYICVKDITAQVQALTSPYGKYQVANVRAKKGSLNPAHPSGNVGTSGGWQIVFVYESTAAGSTTLPSKYITIFDGYANVSSSQNNYDITMSGFQTPPTGNISTRILFGALEGDRDLTGDRFQIKNVANSFVDLSTANRPANNFFNSRITVEGSDFIDRNPASTNTLGFDAGYFTLNNTSNSIITNNQTSAVFRLTSDQELYGLYAVGFSTDIWAPNLDPLVQVASPSIVNPGDTISYTFTVKDVGNDDARNVTISRTLPPEVDLVQPISPLPSGVTYSYNTITRELKFTIADGLVDVAATAINISYKVVVKPQCYFLESACVNSTDAQLIATYSGLKNKNIQTTYSSKALTSCGLGDGKPNTVQINTPPPVAWATEVGALDRIINCNDAQSLAAAQALVPAINKCALAVVKISGAFVATSAACPIKGTYTNTWTFSDKCGRTSPIYRQTITVQDTTKPEIIGTPQDIIVSCASEVPELGTANVHATDNCNGEVQLSVTDAIEAQQCPNKYKIIRTWKAKDACGNESTSRQIITVNDTIKPTFVGDLPQDVTVNCAAIPPIPTLTATDNCGMATVTYFERSTEGGCSGNGGIIRTWIARDTCGNETIHRQTITVQDTTKPEIIGTPQDIIVSCASEVPELGTANVHATDNCNGEVQLSVTDAIEAQQCPNNYKIIRTWKAKDACGNESTSRQIITVNDTIKPTFVGDLPQDSIVCGNISAPAILTAIDNCGTAEVSFVEVIDSVLNAPYITYTRVWVASDACQNITKHQQTILKSPTKTSSIMADVCEGNSIKIGEGSYSETGVYVITLEAQNGCDSIVTLYLTKHLAKRTTMDTVICDGERIVIGEHVFTTSVSNEEIVLPASDVCDSIVTLNLRVIICDTIPIGIDTLIYDTIPVLTSDTICTISLPPGDGVIVASCYGDSTHGTLPHGTWTLNAQTHCLEYTAGTYTGNDTICISACDPSTRQCNTTTIVIIITGVPPIASDDCVQEIQHNSETTINVLENDVDPDHDRLYISAITTQPKYGIASIVGGEGQNLILYTPNKNFCGRDTLYYEVCDGEDGCDTAMVCLHVNCECVFPQVITPNNDGFNDNLLFPCLSRTAGVKLLVWHRWGLIVYEDDNYKNDWQGTFKGGILPSGTYWYSIDYEEPETGKQIHEVNYFMIIN